MNIPIVGGIAAGKSTFVHLSLMALDTKLGERAMTFAMSDQHVQFQTGVELIQGGARLHKTLPDRLPDGLMVDVSTGGRGDRILYLYDPAGEWYTSGDRSDSQTYLDHATGLVVVVDPMALDTVVQSLDDEQRARVHSALGGGVIAISVAADAVVGRLLATLRARGKLRRIRRVAVVVSKADALVGSAIGRDLGSGADGPPSQLAVRTWLETAEWGDSVRALEQHVGAVRFYRSGFDMTPKDLAEPLQWVGGLGTSGIARDAVNPEVRDTSRRELGAPRGFRVGRVAARAHSLVAATLTLLVLGAATAGLIIGVFPGG
ncbi:hypothetical protein ACFTS5_27760 [Nocardia sp. NPDC056952]|uniref:TRAFAC clade GTPase domain-containing protein n=1 Tax=Nocardia sp. NPDC056952 TaxID=3345979 RepID=UPI00362FDDDE